MRFLVKSSLQVPNGIIIKELLPTSGLNRRFYKCSAKSEQVKKKKTETERRVKGRGKEGREKGRKN